MHEMTLAEGILKIAVDYAEKNKSPRVTKIGLLIGEMSYVEMDALNFSFEIMSRNTVAENAQLVVKKIPGRSLRVEYLDMD